MSNPWHDIDDLGSAPWKRGRDESPVEESKGSGDDEVVSDSSSEPQIRFIRAQFEPHPLNGYAVNKGCVLSGRAELPKDTKLTRCTVRLFSRFGGTEEDLQIREDTYASTHINTTDGSFRFDSVPLYIPVGYPDRDTFETPISYKAVISSANCEKEIECVLDLPQQGATDPPVLKQEMYDDKGVESDAAAYPVGGEGYLEGTPVHEFQLIMEVFRYLPTGSANGVFDPRTDEACRKFESDAGKVLRVAKSGGKLVEAGAVTYRGSVDGEVGALVRDEIAVWKRDGFLRPLPCLYHGDFDREAVDKGIKSSGRGHRDDAQAQQDARADDYHDIGKPVLELQQLLKKIGAYTGVLDGSFGDKMRDAVRLFQEYAEKGEFLINGVLTDIGEKLTGHHKGSLDIPTQEMVKKVAERDGEVNVSKPYGGYELKLGDNDKAKKWGGEVRTEDDESVKDLQGDLVRLGYWVSRPNNPTGRGMVCDGDFGTSTENAVKTFQLEHFVLDGQGSIVVANKEKITGIVDEATAEKIKSQVSGLGNKAWSRPGHKPHATWQQPAGEGAYTPNREFKPSGVLFYQLPPSEGFFRSGTIEYGSRNVLSRGTSWRCTPYKVFDDDDCAWLMNDCWGTKEQIDLLKQVGDEWLTKADGTARTVKTTAGTQKHVEPFGVGDISAFNGGVMACHSGHQDGNSTDLNRSPTNAICHTGLYTDAFHREQTYELCRLLDQKGVLKIQFNCHHVIKNIAKTQELKDHHHHIHFDGPQSSGNAPMLAGRFTTCGYCGLFGSCEVRIKRAQYDDGWKDYNPNRDASPRGKGAEKISNVE